MTEKKVYALIAVAVLLIALSFAIPLGLTFAPTPLPVVNEQTTVSVTQKDEALQPLASGTPIKMKIMTYEPETYHSAGAITVNTAIGD